MKILHFVHNYYGFSGASKQAKNLALSIKEGFPSIRQQFFTLSVNKQENQGGNDFIITSSEAGVVKRSREFISILRKYKPDTVHFHGADFILLVICKLFNVKIYWKSTLFRSDDFSTLCVGWRGRIKRILINCIDINNTLTNQMLTVNCEFLPKSKLVTIPNGVLVPKTTNNKRKLAIIISAIIPRKSVAEGIEFFNEHLLNEGYKLLIIGPTHNQLDGFDGSYLNLCRSFESEYISFLDELPHHKVLEHLLSARFLIHLSKTEGLPNVVLEAMAYSVFPILSDMKGLTCELIENGVTGYNVDSDKVFDIENFSGANHRGKEDIITRNSFEVIAKNTVDVYQQLAL